MVMKRQGYFCPSKSPQAKFQGHVLHEVARKEPGLSPVN